MGFLPDNAGRISTIVPDRLNVERRVLTSTDISAEGREEPRVRITLVENARLMRYI